MRAQESITFFNNAAAATSATKQIQGGKYALAFAGTGTGTVDLYLLLPDNATGIKVATQITATTGYQAIDLPPGNYYAIIATFTANYLTLTRIPGD